MTVHQREAPTRLSLDGYVVRAGNEPSEARAIDEAGRSVDYICSTETLDSHGTVLRQNWRLDRYARNPVVLFCHNSRSIPVGTADNVRVENGRLMARVTFATEDVCEEAEECWRAVKAGLLRGISVGFLAHSYRWESENDIERLVLDDLELMELSVCAVPSNPDTLAQRSAIDQLRAQAQRQRPTKDNAMTEEEIKALREAMAKRDADLARATTELTAANVALADARAKADAAAADAAAQRGLVAKLSSEADALKARADAAEDKIARLEIEGRIGRDVDPAEVEDLLAIRRANPDAFARMLARRGQRNDALTTQVIPQDAPAQRADTPASIDPMAALEEALKRNLPAKEGK
jgi:HK97 family phage prohead protease